MRRPTRFLALACGVLHAAACLAPLAADVLVVPIGKPQGPTSTPTPVASTWSRALGAGTRAAPSLARTGLQGAALARAAQATPAAKQFSNPLTPSNLLFAVGATAALRLMDQARDPNQEVDAGGALSFLGDASFWGGLVGSAIGYGVTTALMATLLPAGGGLGLALLPMMAGMTMSMVGWELGSALLGGEGLRAGLTALAPGRLLGQAGGATLGLALGANVGRVVGGTLGSFLGPAGAIAGAMLAGSVGADLGEKLSGAAVHASQGDLDAAVASVHAAEASLSRLQAGVNADYNALQSALDAGDSLAIAQALERLRASTEALRVAQAAATP